MMKHYSTSVPASSEHTATGRGVVSPTQMEGFVDYLWHIDAVLFFKLVIFYLCFASDLKQLLSSVIQGLGGEPCLVPVDSRGLCFPVCTSHFDTDPWSAGTPSIILKLPLSGCGLLCSHCESDFLFSSVVSSVSLVVSGHLYSQPAGTFGRQAWQVEPKLWTEPLCWKRWILQYWL